MLNKILQKVSQLSKTALTAVMLGSGAAALYLCTSTLLAAILLAAYLAYAWDIDKERWYKAWVVLQGQDISEARQAARDRIADMSYEAVITRRAERMRNNEFQELRQQVAALPLPPADPKPEAPPPPAPSETEKIGAFNKHVKAELDKARTAGRDEMTRLIEDRGMDLEQAKEVIRKFWKDGFKDLVLMTLLDMTDKRRGDILYTFRQDDPDELKDLNDILKDISDGKPMVSIIDKAEKATPTAGQ